MISILICGSGLIGPRHALAIHNNPTTSIFAVLDHHNGQQLSQTYNVPLYTSIDHMLASTDKRPTAAIVATPNHTHITLAAQLVSLGIHLLIEKPLSTNPNDSKALYEYSLSKNVKILVGHHRRFNPYIIHTKTLLPQLGSIISILGSWCLKKPDSYFEKKWRTDSSMGGGTILINLIHDIDILLYLFGTIQRVYAQPLSRQRSNSCDEGASIIITFHSGIIANFVCSDNVVSPFNFENGTGENPTIPMHDATHGVYKVFGSNATLSFPDMNLYTSSNTLIPSWLDPIVKVPPTEFTQTLDMKLMAPFDSQLRHFVDMLDKNESCLCSCVDGIRALLVVEAVSESMQRGVVVDVIDFDDVLPDYDSLGISF